MLKSDKTELKKIKKPARYLEAVGRRKMAVARIRLFTKGGKKEILINNNPIESYFSTLILRQAATASLVRMKCLGKFNILINVKGGGLNAQAEAIKYGIARALILFNPDFRKRLKKVGYLTRDSRTRERKKFGLKRARRAPQWKKR